MLALVEYWVEEVSRVLVWRRWVDLVCERLILPAHISQAGWNWEEEVPMTVCAAVTVPVAQSPVELQDVSDADFVLLPGSAKTLHL